MFLVKLKVCELLVCVGRYSVRQNAGLNLLLFFCDITKQILTVSLDQHWKILPLSCVMLPSGLRPSGNITQLRGRIFQCCDRHQSIFVHCTKVE